MASSCPKSCDMKVRSAIYTLHQLAGRPALAVPNKAGGPPQVRECFTSGHVAGRSGEAAPAAHGGGSLALGAIAELAQRPALRQLGGVWGSGVQPAWAALCQRIGAPAAGPSCHSLQLRVCRGLALQGGAPAAPGAPRPPSEGL